MSNQCNKQILPSDPVSDFDTVQSASIMLAVSGTWLCLHADFPKAAQTKIKTRK